VASPPTPLTARVTAGLQKCLKELGLDAELHSTEHEAVVFARTERDAKPFRGVTHLTDREIASEGPGALSLEGQKNARRTNFRSAYFCGLTGQQPAPRDSHPGRSPSGFSGWPRWKTAGPFLLFRSGGQNQPSILEAGRGVALKQNFTVP
jgi:hypothetical protein